MRKSKKGQVWIETVTYTLVAFVLIGLILTFARPKIEELQDQAVIDQSIKMMKQIDSIINEVYEKGLGNKRKLEVSLKKGSLVFNSTNDSIKFIFDGRHEYSESGEPYREGSFDILTTELGTNYQIMIEKEYPNLNITYSGEETDKRITQATTPYVIFITNKGGTNSTIDFEVN